MEEKEICQTCGQLVCLSDKRKLTSLQILRIVSEKEGVPLYTLRHKTRRAPIKAVRHVFFYVARKYGGYTLAELGQAVEKHHATVIHGIRKIEQYIVDNPLMRRKIMNYEILLNDPSLDFEQIMQRVRVDRT